MHLHPGWQRIEGDPKSLNEITNHNRTISGICWGGISQKYFRNSSWDLATRGGGGINVKKLLFCRVDAQQCREIGKCHGLTSWRALSWQPFTAQHWFCTATQEVRRITLSTIAKEGSNFLGKDTSKWCVFVQTRAQTWVLAKKPT